MPNTRKATSKTGETADRKPAPANPSARLAGYSWVKRATTGASIAVVIGIALVLVGARQDIPALVQAGKWLLGIALATWSIIFGVITAWLARPACHLARQRLAGKEHRIKTNTRDY